MKTINKYIQVVAFQIGVNVIGIPDFHEIPFPTKAFEKFQPAKSKFIK